MRRSEAPWLVNGAGLAGEYLSGGMLVGICGAVAFWGFDGFLYAIGLAAGWAMGLFLVAEPLRRRGRFSMGELMAGGAWGRVVEAVMMAVGVSLLVPELVAAGSVGRWLGAPWAWVGIVAVGAAGMGAALAGATGRGRWTGFWKGAVLVGLCVATAAGVMERGLEARPAGAYPRTLDGAAFAASIGPGDRILPATGGWRGRYYVRVEHPDGRVVTWRFRGMSRFQLGWPAATFTECQVVTEEADGSERIDGLAASGQRRLRGGGYVEELPVDMAHPDRRVMSTGPLGPEAFLGAVENTRVGLPAEAVTFRDSAGTHRVYENVPTSGEAVMAAGLSGRLFPGIAAGAGRAGWDRWNWISLMMALVLGAAAMPGVLRGTGGAHGARARAAAVLGMALIGAFCLATLYAGLGAMTGGKLDVTDSNSALLSVCGRWSGAAAVLLLAVLAAGAARWMAAETGEAKWRRWRMAVVGAAAMGAAVACAGMNAAYVLGWGLGIAASATVPALVGRLYWKGATEAGAAASMAVGLGASVVWVGMSGLGVTPFNQPAVVGVPLAAAALVGVSAWKRAG